MGIFLIAIIIIIVVFLGDGPTGCSVCGRSNDSGDHSTCYRRDYYLG